MIYKRFKDLNISQLGYGIMRMPLTEPKGPIDEEKAKELIEHAYKSGMNYFDTAYFYHSGESERFIGQTLAKYPRDTWYLADKMPGNFMSLENGKIKLEVGAMGMEEKVYDNYAEIFELQIERCGVDYFDFYLLHNMAESTYNLYTNEKVGIVEYLVKQKEAGRIRHLGFSSHARPETIEKFLNRYDCFEYAQIQLNYLDWSLQDAGKKYEVLTKHGLAVIAMEPVRGGKLAEPGEKETAILKASRPDDTPVTWAFRFLQALPNVLVVLSGMTTMEQLKENLEIFSKDDPVTESEKAVIQQVVDTMAEFVPCTACRYCCDACPQNLDIPMLIPTYNEAAYNVDDASEVSWYVNSVMKALTEGEKPQACTDCGACSQRCPQDIDIPDIMKKFAAMLEQTKEP